MRIVIFGSREFNNYELLKEKMDYYLSKTDKSKVVILSGLARGADTLGLKYAKEKGLKIETYPAYWDLYGKRAGMLRNKEMFNNCDCGVAFWDQSSRGTKHMIDLFMNSKKGLKVVIY